MKRLILLLAFPSLAMAGTVTVFRAGSGQMSTTSAIGKTGAIVTTVNSPAVAGSAGTGAFTFATSANALTTGAVDTTGANLIVAAVSYISGGTITSFSDNKSNGWSKLTPHDGGSDGANVLFYSSNPVVGAGHTFTVNGSSLFGQVAVLGFSGMLGTPFDSQNGAATTGITTLQPGSVTPSIDNELIVTALSTQNAGVESINAGFATPTQQSWDASHYGIAISYIINGVGTSGVGVNPTWTHSGTTGMMASSIAVFKAGP